MCLCNPAGFISIRDGKSRIAAAGSEGGSVSVWRQLCSVCSSHSTLLSLVSCKGPFPLCIAVRSLTVKQMGEKEEGEPVAPQRELLSSEPLCELFSACRHGGKGGKAVRTFWVRAGKRMELLHPLHVERF